MNEVLLASNIAVTTAKCLYVGRGHTAWQGVLCAAGKKKNMDTAKLACTPQSEVCRQKTDRQTDRQKDKQTDRQTRTVIAFGASLYAQFQ